MKVHVAAVCSFLGMVAMVGFAAEPAPPAASPQAAPAVAAPTVAAPASSAAAAEAQAPATTTVPAADAATGAPIDPTVTTANDAAALAKAAHDLGYTKKLRDGKIVYYCKSEASLGTRMPSTKCYTEDQMVAVVQRSAANRESVADMERKHMNQPGGT
jgi:hypothetical protein